MADVAESIVVLDICEHVRQCSFRFVRYPRQRIQGALASFHCGAEHHYRSGPQPVRDHFALLGYKSLGPVDIQHIQPPGMKQPPYYLQLTGILDISGASGQLRQCRLGDIILCRAEAACDNHYFIMPEFCFQITDDLIPVISE